MITDKPQLNLPAGNAPQTPQERVLEQMRLRQQQRSDNPEQEGQPQPQPEQPPPVQQETNINPDGSLNAPAQPTTPPATTPNQLPQAQDVPIPGL